MKREYNFSKRKRGPVVPPEPGQVRRRSEKLERATGVEPATSSLGRAPTRESRGNPRMQILELQGFSNFRIPASDPDFDRSPGNFDRNLPERDVQVCVTDVERMAIDSDNLLANCVRDPTSSLDRKTSNFNVQASRKRLFYLI